MTNWFYKIIIYLGIVLFIASCGFEKPAALMAVENELPEVVDYNFHVRPILSDKCFLCHGPDVENNKAGLRLDIAENAFNALESGNGRAIVPGSPGRSEAYRRITSEDPNVIMPPPYSHLALSTKEKAMITKWIEQGAEYKPHWAFVAPKKESPPEVQNQKWVSQPIDNFILKTLETNKLSPSEEASKETLIRRVTFDLTGLPPSLDDIDEFVGDSSPDAFDQLVDELLNTEAYGERMAADWMDVARYADSDGYLDDKHREFSPWRDWVIEAFNNNMRYDQFITWQLAGDLMPNATKESTLATAFNRLHKKNSEAGIVFEEYRVEYVADRTNTLGTGIMGMSLECARCHDHKYDPISQKDYYQLFGFFNSTFEIGSPVYGPDQVPGPAMLLSSKKEDLKIDQLKTMISRIENTAISGAEDFTFTSWVHELEDTATLEQHIEQATVAYYPLDEILPTDKKESYTTANKKNNHLPATLVEPIQTDGAKGKALVVSDYNKIQLGEKIGWYDRTDAFSFQLQIQPDTIYNEAGILWHSEELRIGLKGYSLHLTDNKIRFIMAKTWPQNAMQVTTKKAIDPKKWSQVTVTYDGSSKAKGVSIFVDGEKQALAIDYDNLYKSILYVTNIHTYGFKGITLGARDKFIPFKNGGLDEIKVFDRQLSNWEVLYSYHPGKAKELLTNKESHESLLKHHYNLVIDPKASEARKALKKARDEENELVTNIKEIMVMGDLPEPRPTYVLDRGAYDAPSEQVEPNTPNAILPFKDYPKNRYGLSQWLFDKENPLTARVYVNRIWQMYFGKGIVSTSNDFGSQGSLPTHPELLDWMALYFMDSDWDIKALQKLIVTSATYKQNSKVTIELLEKDPENLLLTRGPRYRLPAEMIRDNALAASGLLVHKQGGPGVYPYQPEGLWDGLTTKWWAYRYLQGDGEGLYRRSLYTIWKRQSPPPFMQIFDVDARGDCIVNRKLSSTPLQALNLLNDPQFVEASRVIAENLLKTEKDTTIRLEKAFRILTGRKPDAKEQIILADFYQEELAHFTSNRTQALDFMKNGEMDWDKNLNVSEIAALGVVVSAIMNTTEAFTKK
ncbi:MAG: hypothetical protein COA50_07865 [Flavobacteriaceae bacterium]|nr:MAG: hypothetical protein COA50_07865 [Flavobacteriaceae bacterium]